jgi:hypothetical protein
MLQKARRKEINRARKRRCVPANLAFASQFFMTPFLPTELFLGQIRANYHIPFTSARIACHIASAGEGMQVPKDWSS